MQTVASAWKINRKPEIANWNLLRQIEWLKKLKGEKHLSANVTFQPIASHASLPLVTVIAQKFCLPYRSILLKSAGHEVCSNVYLCLHCVCIANICGLATALSGKTGATV
jgi:hypothetical protein